MANVSVGTVDRIIHNRGQVSKENIAKVNAIIKEVGYKKNVLASNLALNKKIKFAILIPRVKEIDYWNYPIIGIEKAIKEIEIFGVSVDFCFFEDNEVSFLNQAQKVLQEDYDGLVFAPVFHDESVQFLEKYQKKETPVVLIDSNLQEINWHTYIGQDSYQSGFLGGKLISFGCTIPTKILIVNITRNIKSTVRTNVNLQRLKGFYDYFEQNTEESLFTFTEIQSGFDTEHFLTKELFEGIDGVFVPNSRAYLIAKFIQDHQLKGIRVVGYELLDQNVEFLNSGVIHFLIHQKPEEQGYLAINHLYKKIVLNENFSSQSHAMPLEIIVKENYKKW